jgi:hypothetical protein
MDGGEKVTNQQTIAWWRAGLDHQSPTSTPVQLGGGLCPAIQSSGASGGGAAAWLNFSRAVVTEEGWLSGGIAQEVQSSGWHCACGQDFFCSGRAVLQICIKIQSTLLSLFLDPDALKIVF